MSAWTYAALVNLISLVPCGYLCFLKRDPIDRLIGLVMAGAIETLTLIILAQDVGKPEFYDVGFALSILSFGGGLVFVRFLEKWL